MDGGKSDTANRASEAGKTWPEWARWLVTAGLLIHVAAVLAGALGAPPSSRLEHEVAEFFGPYHQVLDQGKSYRYYSSAFPPTPVVNATLTFADGRPEKVVRIPERGLWPRLLYQRQLALAHGLMEDFEAHRRAGDGSKSPWAHAFAGHLCRTNPGCASVALHLQMHLVPTIERVQKSLATPTLTPVNLDADEFTTAPERIGVFPCDGS